MKRRSRNNEICVDGTKKRTNEAQTPIAKTAVSLPNERNKMKNQTTTKTESLWIVLKLLSNAMR